MRLHDGQQERPRQQRKERGSSRSPEYRELTSKLYDNIDGLEIDIKDKDSFLQTVVKTRNACQIEVANLKKMNSELIKENNNPLEKNEQFDGRYQDWQHC